MKDTDIADVLAACAERLRGFADAATIEGMKREVFSVAETLEGLTVDLREG